MLTPLDIENKRFKKEVFGYNQIEVEDFLSNVSAEYEKLFKDNSAALARINMLTDAIKQYKSMEETLQNAMIVAQKSGEDIRAEAKAAADRLLSEATVKAQNIISDAKRQSAEISYKAEEIKMTSELFKKQTIELLNEQLDVLKKRHSISMSDAAEALRISPLEEAAGVVNSAPSAEPAEVDLSKILADVGKISQSIDDFTMNDGTLGDSDELAEAETSAEFAGEPSGVRELFEG